MKEVTKKRTKAVLIDQLIYNLAFTGAGAAFRRKKQVKSEFLSSVIVPTMVMWGMEYIQLRKTGQTTGYKKMGLVLESEDGSPLTSSQIIKRILYRDSVSGLVYFKDRDRFEAQNGAQFPHDTFAGTIVKETRNG
ncbi:RDD family protein [Domibacillus sp. A3M-37]|uniref:RDD family protein n=1 Tax=Domibacillus sp. A3M-37 TaxID=2962037 RepID=UPI0020B72CF6|nr:RDD family protein [Domibacillus sp. A3M-37]MCP3760966.1 RDD family protein [Domibacillus sp. A3M-37]